MTSTHTPRSQPTRDRILEAARTLFAAYGYDATTLRQIALQAETNVALVIRYYESKEQLFATAADFDLELPALNTIDSAMLGEHLVSHFLFIWEEKNVHRELVALLRAASSHPAAKARMQEIFHFQLLRSMLDLGYNAIETEMRASLVASQMLGFAMMRYVLEFPTDHLNPEIIVRVLGKTIHRYLCEPL